MIYKEEIAFKMAELLLKIKAVKINVDNPFTWLPDSDRQYIAIIGLPFLIIQSELL